MHTNETWYLDLALNWLMFSTWFPQKHACSHAAKCYLMLQDVFVIFGVYCIATYEKIFGNSTKYGSTGVGTQFGLQTRGFTLT